MYIDTLEDSQNYGWRTLSSCLKEFNFPSSFFWIYTQEKKGRLVSPRHPTSHKRLYSGAFIREFIRSLKREMNEQTK